MIKRIAGVALAGALALSVAGAAPAAAKDGDVIERGSCSSGAEWKLKLSPENSKIEVEYEVDSNVNGQAWNVKIFKNGDRIFGGTRETTAPSGSFSVRVVTSDPAGTDDFRAKAVNGTTDEVCRGTASF
jgi:hypothetical protein